MNNQPEPPTKPILSLCMIVKNERENLPRCLASAKPYVDEMIVVDTGSNDGTPEIAANYGAKIKYFEWQHDFAAARNYSMSQASGDWILILDADEQLVVESEKFLEQLSSERKIIAYLIALTEAKGHKLTPSYQPRLLRNIKGVEYTGFFHEHPMYENQSIKSDKLGRIEGVIILHYGYGKEQLLQKNINRNIPILERNRQEESLSLMLLYCLAGMYSDTGQTEKAQECYEEAFDRLLPNLIDGIAPDDFTFVPSLICILGVQSLQKKDYETARWLCQRGLEWCPNYPPLNYLAGTTIRALGFPLGAVAYLENCIQLGREGNYYNEPFDPSYMTTYPAYDMGCIYLDQQRPQDALAAFELALSFDPNFQAAREKIGEIRQS